MLAETRLVFPLLNITLVISLSLLSTSVKVFVRSIVELLASSVTAKSAIALATVGASSTALTAMVNVWVA